MRNPLYSVSRESYGGAAEGSASAEGAGLGICDPGIEPEPSGRAVVGSYTLWRGRKVYELKNHLGNVLAVVSDVKLGQSNSSLVNYYTADPSSSLRAGVVEMSDYEPAPDPRIGWMLLAKRHWVSGEGYRTDSYRYGFNGKEADDEWNGDGNSYDFGARLFDARVCRWLSRDPLEAKYSGLSPYSGMANSPICIVDVDGRDIYFFDENDNLLLIVKTRGADVGYRLEGAVKELFGIPIVVDPSHLNTQGAKGNSEWQLGFSSMFFGSPAIGPSQVLIGHDAYGIGIGPTGIVGGGASVGVEAVYFPRNDQWGFYTYYGPGFGAMIGTGGIYGLIADKKDPENGTGADTWPGYFHMYSMNVLFFSAAKFWSVQGEGEGDWSSIFTEWDPMADDASWEGEVIGVGGGWDFGLAKTHTWFDLSGQTNGRIDGKELECLKEKQEGSKVKTETGKIENYEGD